MNTLKQSGNGSCTITRQQVYIEDGMPGKCVYCMNTVKLGGDGCRKITRRQVSVESGSQENLNIWSVVMLAPSRSQNLLEYEKKCEKNYSYVSDGAKLKKKIGGGLLALIFFYFPQPIYFFFKQQCHPKIYTMYFIKKKKFSIDSLNDS